MKMYIFHETLIRPSSRFIYLAMLWPAVEKEGHRWTPIQI